MASLALSDGAGFIWSVQMVLQVLWKLLLHCQSWFSSSWSGWFFLGGKLAKCLDYHNTTGHLGRGKSGFFHLTGNLLLCRTLCAVHRGMSKPNTWNFIITLYTLFKFWSYICIRQHLAPLPSAMTYIKKGVSLEGALGMRKNFTDERNEVNFRSKLNDVGMKFLSSPWKSLVSNNKNPELFNSNIIEQ